MVGHWSWSYYHGAMTEGERNHPYELYTGFWLMGVAVLGAVLIQWKERRKRAAAQERTKQ